MQKNKILILFVLLSFSNNVFAQDFEIAPVKMEFNINPEESQTKILSVTNHANFKTSFTISFADFIIDKDGKKQAIEKNSTKTSCVDWITPEKTFFDIDPNEHVDIKITMQVPVDDYTSRWAFMYIQTVKVQSSFDVDKSGFGAGVHLSGRINVEVSRKPTTPVTDDLKIKDLRELIKEDSENRIFIADILNLGKNIANCKITFIASDLNTAEEIEFDPIHLISYPGFLREVRFELPNTMPPGKYSLVALLDYGKTTTIKGVRLDETLLILPKKEESEK